MGWHNYRLLRQAIRRLEDRPLMISLSLGLVRGKRHQNDMPCCKKLGAESEGKRATLSDPGEAVLGNKKNRLRRLDLKARSLRLEPFSEELRAGLFRNLPHRTCFCQKPPQAKPHAFGMVPLTIFPGSHSSP